MKHNIFYNIAKYFTTFYHLIQIYTLDQEKRGLCPYDDKRYLLAELPNGTPNPNTHAYGHRELAAEANIDMDMPDQPGADLIIEQRQPPAEPEADADENPEPYQTTRLAAKQELRFKRRNARVTKVLAKRGRRDSNGEEIGGDEYEQVPDGDENGELDGAQLRRAERAAAARPGAAIRMGDVLERIIARDHIHMPDSPPKRMPVLLPQPTPERAGTYRIVVINL